MVIPCSLARASPASTLITLHNTFIMQYKRTDYVRTSLCMYVCIVALMHGYSMVAETIGTTITLVVKQLPILFSVLQGFA